jgi:hypothetical protein
MDFPAGFMWFFSHPTHRQGYYTNEKKAANNSGSFYIL